MSGKGHWTDEDYRPLDPYQHSWENNGVDLFPTEVPEMEHGFHGTVFDVEGTVLATADRPDSKKNFDESPSYFVNYWTPNPLARLYRDGLADPENNPGQPMEGLRADAEKEAWNWAEKSSVYPNDHRPRVYEGRAVTAMDRPVGLDSGLPADINMGVEHILPMAAGAFEVTDTHWIPPGQPGKAVQGTLPHVNWNQFGAPNVGNPEDVAAGLTEFDRQEGWDNRIVAEIAEERARPQYGPAKPNLARYRARRAEAAGQMRLPGL